MSPNSFPSPVILLLEKEFDRIDKWFCERARLLGTCGSAFAKLKGLVKPLP